MMRKYYKLMIISMVLMVLGFSGCKEEEPAAPISPAGYPVATFTTDFTGTEVTVGDVITYTITLDKMMDVPITFGVRFDTLDTKALAVEHDIAFEEVTMAAYSTEAELSIQITEDQVPMASKSLRLEVGAFTVGEKYLLNPSTVNPKLDLTIKHRADALTIALYWPDDHDDWDGFVVDEAGAGEWTGWGGATGADPEFMYLLNDVADVPDDTYYVQIDPWSVAQDVTNFQLSIGHPNQSVDVFNFTFDASKTADYPTLWAYSAVKIVKTGSTYVCTLLPEWGPVLP